MFDYGIEVLGGLLVEDEQNVWWTTAEGGQKELFSSGIGWVTVQSTRGANEAMRGIPQEDRF
jgi:hypothetical protein